MTVRKTSGPVVATSLIFLALTGFASAQDVAWGAGRVTVVRVLERGEEGAKVTPPVQDDSGGKPGRSYGASAYLELESARNIYRAQYTGPQIDVVEQLRGETVQFRITGKTLYLRRPSGRSLELHLVPARRVPSGSKTIP